MADEQLTTKDAQLEKIIELLETIAENTAPADESWGRIMSWLKEVQVNKTEQRVYLMDLEYHVFAELPCSTDFYPGFNDKGEPRSSPADGVYKATVW